MTKSLEEAKQIVSEKYGFDVIEESDLGEFRKGEPFKGEARTPNGIAIRADLDNTMKLIAIAHEAGHLIGYKNTGIAYLNGGSLKIETRAWLNGLPLAIEIGIFEEYTHYWRVHLDKM